MFSLPTKWTTIHGIQIQGSVGKISTLKSVGNNSAHLCTGPKDMTWQMQVVPQQDERGRTMAAKLNILPSILPNIHYHQLDSVYMLTTNPLYNSTAITTCQSISPKDINRDIRTKNSQRIASNK